MEKEILKSDSSRNYGRIALGFFTLSIILGYVPDIISSDFTLWLRGVIFGLGLSFLLKVNIKANRQKSLWIAIVGVGISVILFVYYSFWLAV